MKRARHAKALAAATLVLALVVAWAVHERGPGGEPAPAAPAVAAASGPAFPAPWSALPASASAPPAAAGSAPAAEAAQLENVMPLRFRADAGGKLVADAQAGHDIERLAALNSPGEALDQIRQAGSSLPPAAQRQLVDLYHRHEQYAAAVARSFVPGQLPADEQEAARQLDTLHRLRVEHFGEEAAASMFGEEEAAARQMVALMRAQDDPGLTMQQKAEMAQAAWLAMKSSGKGPARKD